MKQQRINRLILSLFLIGFLIFTYPFYSQSFNKLVENYQIKQYQTTVSKETLSNWKEKNKAYQTEGIKIQSDPFDDSDVAHSTPEYRKKHYIGLLTIPNLGIEVSLFDTTNSQLLQMGATVLDGTSMPVGGKGNHSVISAHNGIPQRKLFTGLEEIKKGDQFLIMINNQSLAYQVTKLTIVEPTDTSVLKSDPDKDLVTLVTCTPYTINTHRLLVTGERVPFEEKLLQQKNALSKTLFYQNIAVLVGILLVVIVVLGLLIKNFRQSKPEDVAK